MTRLSFLVLLLAGMANFVPTASPAQQPGTTVSQQLNQSMIAVVTGAALQFMAPRTLKPIPLPQMALWGLRGLTVLDARLLPELYPDDRGKKQSLRLSVPGRVLLAVPAPADADPAAWGDAVGQVVRAAWDASEPMRQAGTSGILSSFFDELFGSVLI